MGASLERERTRKRGRISVSHCPPSGLPAAVQSGEFQVLGCVVVGELSERHGPEPAVQAIFDWLESHGDIGELVSNGTVSPFLAVKVVMQFDEVLLFCPSSPDVLLLPSPHDEPVF